MTHLTRIDTTLPAQCKTLVRDFTVAAEAASINFQIKLIINLLKDSPRYGLPELVKEFNKYLQSLVTNISANKATDKDFERVTFWTLCSFYLQNEALSFGSKDKLSPVRLQTQFSEYARTVERIVINLERQERDDEIAYEYYTILNRTPRQFFNLCNHGTDMRWAVHFLESFCFGFPNCDSLRGIHTTAEEKEPVQYHRRFIACKELVGDRVCPNVREVLESSKMYMLCWKKDDRPLLYFTQLERTEFLSAPVAGNAAETKMMKKLIGWLEKFKHITELDDLITRNRNAEKPEWSNGYIIIHDTDLTAQKKLMEELPEGIILRGLLESIERYHDAKRPMRVLSLPTEAVYREIFDENLPHDFFAVREKKSRKWRLVLGAKMETTEPLSVGMVFLTNERVDDAKWSGLSQKLDSLFDDDKLVEGAVLYHIKDKLLDIVTSNESGSD